MAGGVDINSLLQNGYWSNTRSKSPDPRFASTAQTPSYAYDDYRAIPRTRYDTPSIGGQSTANLVHKAPPAPIVEDEADSLAKEHGSVVTASPTEEPPHRGDVEQHPILQVVHEHNPERRFVFVPDSTVTSDDVSSAGSKSDQKLPTKKEAAPKSPQVEEKPSYEANTRRKYDSLSPEVTEPSHKSERDECDERDSRPTRERRRSRLENLPSIVTDFDHDGRPEERQRSRSRGVSRARSATTSSQREEDYFSPRRSSRNLATADSMLSPDIIKHSTKGRDRAYYDYSGSTAPSSHHRRHKSMQPEDMHYGKALPNQRKPVDDGGRLSATSPTMTKRHSAMEVPRATRRTSHDHYDQGRNYSEAPPSRSGRKSPSPPQSQPERESRESLRPRAPSFRSKREPSSYGDDRRVFQKEDRYSSSLHPQDRGSAGEDERRRDERRRRRKSVIHDGRNGYLATPTESQSAIGRSSKPSSPLASPRASQSDLFRDRNGGPPSPSSRSATFPSTKDGRSSDRSYTLTHGSPERPLSRASTARSAANTAAYSAYPVITGFTGSTLDSPTKRSSNPASKAPSIHSGADTRSISPSSPAAVSFPSKQAWQPAKFDPAQDAAHLAASATSYRRFSEDISRGELPDLPDCPRMREEAGHHDWLTLPRCNNFNICPSCYQSAFENTRFRHLFVPAPLRSLDRLLKCDFGTSEWYHIAWLLTHKYNKPDLRLFHGIATVAANNQPCTGPVEDYRFWHTIKDPATQRPVRKFNICLSCAKTVEALLPNLFGVFIPMDSPAESTRGICDMHNVGYNGARKRFMLYFDAMETVSDQALAANRAPDLRMLADKVREISYTDECTYGRPASNRKWYTMRSVPEVTVCQECFNEVVMPELERDDSGVQGNFLHKPQALASAACQLYSPRMRSAFQKAVRKRDLWYFENKIRERRAKEQEIYTKMAGLDRNVLGPEWCDSEMYRLQREWQRWE
ncbi:hypothetical protein PG996_015323 [Apiospora saccharicola]|uniref:Uncharacterized protein n=1 Tax=Apiospora saccharicola TaxID=335842 RepID=A0ABR1TKU5_9PEZI